MGLSKWARRQLEKLRTELDRVDPERIRTVLLHESGDTRWWTWAGCRANAVRWAALERVAPTICDPISRFTNRAVVLRGDTMLGELSGSLIEGQRSASDAPQLLQSSPDGVRR